MISLLVTFFLMMMTFSTHDQFDVKEAGVGLLHGGGGVWKNPVCTATESQIDADTISRLSRNLSELVDEQKEHVSLRSVSDGFTISFDLASSFEPGAAELSPVLRANLERLAT